MMGWGALGHVFGYALLAASSLNDAGECAADAACNKQLQGCPLNSAALALHLLAGISAFPR